jgi:peptidoglycan/LPS O-acetylase OafA/YrhL
MQEQTINQSNDTQPKEGNKKIVNRLIKGYIIFIALANIFVAVLNFFTYRDLSTHDDPTLPHWPFLFMSIMGLPVLYGLWNNKRWGFFTFLGIQAIALLITFVVLKTMPSPGTFGGLGLFIAIFTPRIKQMT